MFLNTRGILLYMSKMNFLSLFHFRGDSLNYVIIQMFNIISIETLLQLYSHLFFHSFYQDVPVYWFMYYLLLIKSHTILSTSELPVNFHKSFISEVLKIQYIPEFLI